MIRKIISLPVLTVFVLMAACAIVTAGQESWQFFKQLPAGSPGFAQIRLDADVMQNCQDNFADIRITDEQGREIPCQVIQPGREETVQTVNVINAVEYEDGSALVIDMGENPRPHNKLVLNVPPMGDYLRDVEILASNDATNWGKIGTGKIFSYQNVRFNQINYPTSTMRYVQVNIKKQPGESTLQVNSAQLFFLSSNVYDGKLLPAAVVSARSNQSTTEMVVDLGVSNFMITNLQMQCSDRNYDRKVVVSSSDKPVFTGEESQKASGRIIAYDFNNNILNQNNVTVEQFCRRYLMISIMNQDSPPLDIQAIKVYGAAPTFIADLAVPSILWYGNPQATMPTYDLKEYANLITKTDLPVVEAGQQQINPDYKAPVIPWTEQNKWLLDAAIVLVAGAFVIIIIRKSKQLKNELKERQEHPEDGQALPDPNDAD